MASEEEKKLLDSVTTFVAELPGLPLAEALKKFQGKHTARTLAAARRMCGKKRQVKVPRNLLRQLWRITGGWIEITVPNHDFLSRVTFEKKVTSGEAGLWSGSHMDRSGTYYYLAFRGEVVGVPQNWRDENRRNEAFMSMNVPFNPNPAG